jgi:chromosome segregation ATPase
MSRFTSAQREGILAEARANISKRKSAPAEPRQQFELVYKTHDNAPVRAPDEGAASGSWWEGVDARIMEAAKGIAEALQEELAGFRRELELLQRELATVRDEVAVERGLRALRSEVEEARAQVPKVPAIAAKLEAENARLRRDLATTKDKLGKLRVDQSIADHRLAELSKATAKRAAVLETKIETTISSFTMREVHPDARAALHNFATDVLKDSSMIFTTAGTA